MAWTASEKNIKIHTIIDGVDYVEDRKTAISYRKLKALGAKRRVYKSTKEVFFLIETDYELTL